MLNDANFLIGAFLLILIGIGYTLDKWLKKIHESLEGIRRHMQKE